MEQHLALIVKDKKEVLWDPLSPLSPFTGVPVKFAIILAGLISANYSPERGFYFDGEKDPLALLNLLHRFYTLDWLIKIKWDSRRRITGLHGTKTAYKPLGLFWASVFDICLEVYASENSHKRFADIFVEQELEGIISINEHRKSESIKKLQSENRRLGNLENPFESPFAKEFVDKAISEANASDVFRKTKWRAFKQARSALLKEIKSDQIISLKVVEKDKIFWLGHGRKGKGERATHVRAVPVRGVGERC